METFNCIETIAISECKQLSSNLFENEITDKLIAYMSSISI